MSSSDVSDVVVNEVVENTKFNTLETKVNGLEKKILDAATLIHINQFNTDKQREKKNREKNWWCWLKNIRYKWFSD